MAESERMLGFMVTSSVVGVLPGSVAECPSSVDFGLEFGELLLEFGYDRFQFTSGAAGEASVPPHGVGSELFEQMFDREQVRHCGLTHGYGIRRDQRAFLSQNVPHSCAQPPAEILDPCSVRLRQPGNPAPKRAALMDGMQRAFKIEERVVYRFQSLKQDAPVVFVEVRHAGSTGS